MKAYIKNQRGAALFTILAIVFTTSAILGVTVTAGMQRAHMARRLSDRIHAKVIAEAGANEAYATLVTNFQARVEAENFPETAYAGGSYDVGLQNVSDYVSIIHSTGHYGTATADVILDVKNYVDGLPGSESLEAYKYAVVSNGETSWSGAGVFTSASKIHSNDAFTLSGSGELNSDVTSSLGIRMNGNSGKIDGDVIAPSIKGFTKNVTGSVTEEDVSQLHIPEIDLTPYYNWALANGEVYNGPLTLTTATAPAGGIMWVNGDLNLAGSETMTGCFIATGDIKLTGSSDQIKVDGLPGFVSRDGDVTLAGSGDYEGLIYSRIGDVEISGGGSLTGSIIAGGDFKKTGVSTTIAYEDSTPTAPGEEGTETATLAVTAWQK